MSPGHDQYRALPGLLRRSGGLQWHFRALRHRRLHDPFRESLGAFLQAWNPETSQLIIVGPSAGWFLPDSFLCRFSRLTLIDLDTSAPLFFALWHGRRLRRVGTLTEWIQGDFVDCLPKVLSAEGDAAILFCNVLGQLALEREDYEARLGELPQWLAGRRWASFHDRYSARIPDGTTIGANAFTSLEKMDAPMLQRLGLGGEWMDHGTDAVLPAGVLRHYFPWHIVPNRLHWIEAGVAA